jgi:hypothetical protein
MSSDSDELKDFRYYADRAEASIKEAREHTSPTRQGAHESVTYMLKTAAVYAELAKAAPKAAPEPQYIVLTTEQARDYAAMKGNK